MRYRDGSALARALELLGEEEIAEKVTGAAEGGLPPGSGNYVYNQVAQRSSKKSAALTNGTNGISNGINGAIPQVVEDVLENAATVQQTFVNASSAGQNAESLPDANMGMYVTPPEAGVTRPFHNGAIQEEGQRHSRFASIITVMILLATAMLLSFSIYLVVQLRNSHKPGSNATTTATVVANGIKVPDLIRMDYAKAEQIAIAHHLQIRINNKQSSGIVINQDPIAGRSVAANTTILVDLASPATVIIPNDLVGQDFMTVEQELTQLGLRYHENPQGSDPTQGTNIVVRTDPSGGTPVPKNAIVQLYIVNYNNNNGAPTVGPGAGTGITPIVTATPKPQPTATPKPQPTATPVPPTATPVPPTATPVPPTPTP